MSLQDPIADMLTCIRNAQRMGIKMVTTPFSNIKKEILNVLQAEGFIDNIDVTTVDNKKDLKISLKYYDGRAVIERIDRVSRPALRIYKGCDELPMVKGGLGVVIISTPKGVMSDKQARANKVGGELILYGSVGVIMSIASTSRIGRKPVVVPAGVEVKINDLDMSFKGPKGKLSIKLHPFVKIDYKNNEINVHSTDMTNEVITGRGKRLYKSITGTIRANIMNAVHGVTEGNERKLTLVGVGYRAQSKGKVLSLSLGYSHPTDFNVPEGITIETPTQTEIIIKGASDELVGEVAAKIRAKRKPEPYKGKGIRYSDEVVEIKETKKK